MAYDHDEIADAVYKALLKDPWISLRILSDRLGVERHTIRRGLLRRFGMTFRDLQRNSLEERASALREEQRQHSAKEMSFALGYRSATGWSRLIRRRRGRGPA